MRTWPGWRAWGDGTRKLRAALSALGIAIGVASIVAVLGLSSSSAAGLNAEIAALGTNLLTVQTGQGFSGQPAELPMAAPAMISHLPGVYAVQDTGSTTASAYRSPLIPLVNTNALTVDAATLSLPATAGTSLAQGQFLNAATAREPVCVLGAAAAQLLGIDRLFPGERIWTGNMWLYLAGILKLDQLSLDIDSSVLVGYPFAEKHLGFDGHPTTIYVKAINSQVNRIDNLLAAQANPEDPSAVDVTQPSRWPGRPSRGKERVQHVVPRFGRGRALGRRGRGGQHHDHLSSGTPQRDRAAPGAGRHQGPHPHPVPVGSYPAGRHRRHRGHRDRRARHRHLRPHQRLGHRHPHPGRAGGIGAAMLIGAIAGRPPALRAARLSPTQALWSL